MAADVTMNLIFEARGLSRQFSGVRALSNVEVLQHQGETLGMIGPNGSGKTTFVNAVTGHLRLDAGRVRFGGNDITGAKPHKVAQAGLARTYQAIRVFARRSVRENLQTAGLMLGLKCSVIDTDDCRALLEWLRLDQRLDAEAGSLTLFEQRRLELAMRLVMRPRLVMLDEPVGGLAPSEIRAMMQVLDELKARCNLFVIEHTMRVIRELADRVVVLITGDKIADGPPVDILKDQRVIDQYLGTSHA
jgi:ABC-type branched-subunit amino acid transport system ATPase component